MRTLTLIHLFFLSTQVKAQKNTLDIYYHNLKTGFCGKNTAQCKSQQLRYLHACEKIGTYYYSAEKYDSAFFYYSLPAFNYLSNQFRNNFKK
jgi:hypothetical protein